MQVNNLFCVPIARQNIDLKIHNLNKVTVVEWVNSNELIVNQGDPVQTSYYNKNIPCIIKELGLINLEQFIIEKSKIFLDYIGINIGNKLLKINSWVNVFMPNAFEHRHLHFGSLVSGCYYVEVPDGSGPISFYSSNDYLDCFLSLAKLLNVQVDDTNPYNNTSFNIHPSEGDLLFFPGWLPHMVYQNESDKPRISLAFNVSIA